MPLLDLEALKIISNCDGKYLSFIISNCINLKELSLGMNNKISDDVIVKVFMLSHHFLWDTHKSFFMKF